MSYKKQKSKSKLPMIITLSVIGVAFVGTAVFAILRLLNIWNDRGNTANIIEYPDVRAYFEERAEIVSVTPVKDSKNTLSEQDAVEELRSRGFTQYPITSDYTIDGESEDDTVVSDDSSLMHPIYRTYFMSFDNVLWSIALVDGKVIATPSSYNLEHTGGVPIEVSETEEIASYDLSTNSIYLTIPFDTTIDVRVVDRIDSETLDSFDLEG